MIRVLQAVTDQAETDALTKALERAYHGDAELVVASEKALAEFLRAPNYQVVYVSSGTAAPHLAGEALGVEPGDHDIETGINYPANHLHSLYRQPGESLPVSEEVCGQILSLPLHCALSDDQVDRIIDLVRGYVKQKGKEERP